MNVVWVPIVRLGVRSEVKANVEHGADSCCCICKISTDTPAVWALWLTQMCENRIKKRICRFVLVFKNSSRDTCCWCVSKHFMDDERDVTIFHMGFLEVVEEGIVSFDEKEYVVHSSSILTHMCCCGSRFWRVCLSAHWKQCKKFIHGHVSFLDATDSTLIKYTRRLWRVM